MSFKLDKNFEEKVYAGVLGKIIGVFLGRPFEGWSHERIMRELARKIIINGKINSYYVLIAKSSILDEKFDKLILELKKNIYD